MSTLKNQTDEQYYDDFDNYGYYRYTSLENLVNDFMLTRVGEDELIQKINRNKIVYHFKRGIQELNYDVIRSTRGIEVKLDEDTASLTVPEDFISIIQVSRIDSSGFQRIILEAPYTTAASTNPLQDNTGEYLYDDDGELMEASLTLAVQRWQSPDPREDDSHDYQDYIDDIYRLSNTNEIQKRFGINPELANQNGSYVFDEGQGKIFFNNAFKKDENETGQDILVRLDYVSDGLAKEEADIQINKLAEQALIDYVLYNVSITRNDLPDYVVRRLKKNYFSSMRNAKIRLSNLNMGELIGVFRSQTRWIKT